MRKYMFVSAVLLLCLGWAAPAQSAGSKWTSCNVGKISVKGKTLGVYCAPPYTGDSKAWNEDVPNYLIAFEGASEARINAMLQLLIVAKVHKLPVRVRYTAGSGKNPPGCKASNCRRLEAITLK